MRTAFVICFSIVLLNLQEIYDTQIFKMVPVLCFGYLIFKNQQSYGYKLATSYLMKLIFAVCFLMGICSLRSNNQDLSLLYTIGRPIFLCLFLISFSYASVGFLRENSYNLYKTIQQMVLLPFLMASAINLLLWVVGYKTQRQEASIGQAMLLSTFGINIDRVEFPFSPGFNSTSTLIGGLLCVALTVFVFYKENRIFSLLCIAIFLIQLLLIDTRSALVYAIIIPVFAYFLMNNKVVLFLFRHSYVLLVLGPFILTALLPLMSSISSLETMSRSSEDLATGNSRFIIWGFSIKEMLDFKFQHLFGYGEFGHAGSGASKNWSYIFSNWENSELKSPHNTFFSIFFDYGYVGLLVYLHLLYIALKIAINYIKNGLKEYSVFAIFLLYNILVSITESTSGFYFFSYPYLFFGMLLLLSIYINIRYFSVIRTENTAKVKSFQPHSSSVLQA